MSNQQAQSGSGQRQRKRGHYDQRVNQGTELEEKNQEDQHQADEQRIPHLAGNLLLVLGLAPVIDAVARRQRHRVELFARVGKNLTGQAVAAWKGAHTERADAVSAHDPARLPIRRERRHCLQRNLCPGHGRHHISVGHVLEALSFLGV